ncbi:MAG: hypothetical protein HQM12_20840 [SAR324 cluster bacterium]|nr:hypothetical protein [SAR324 cluster bacterium]
MKKLRRPLIFYSHSSFCLLSLKRNNSLSIFIFRGMHHEQSRRQTAGQNFHHEKSSHCRFGGGAQTPTEKARGLSFMDTDPMIILWRTPAKIAVLTGGRKAGTPHLSRMLKRLHTHGLIKKIGKTFKYYLTKFGKKVIISALKTRRLILIPQLAH